MRNRSTPLAAVVAVVALSLPFASCASKRAAPSGDAAASSPARSPAAADRKLAIQSERVEAARAALAAEEAAARDAVALAEAELEIAKKSLAQFDSTGSAIRLDRERLNLAGAQDRHREAEEELRQLEMMYAEQDLADKTREIVVNRGRRSLERAAKALDIQLRELSALESQGLPQERAKLALDVDRKTRELERARRSAADSVREKRIALLGAESDLAEAREAKEAAAATQAPR